jgi:gentisate 1,2-dioxygenase
MTGITTLQPNTAYQLQIHRVTTVTLHVLIGHLNVIIGENLYTLGYDDEITIPKNTPFAIANLSPSAVTFSQSQECVSLTNDVTLLADTDGTCLVQNPSPSLQATLSLYRGLLDMRVTETSVIAA